MTNNIFLVALFIFFQLSSPFNLNHPSPRPTPSTSKSSLYSTPSSPPIIDLLSTISTTLRSTPPNVAFTRSISASRAILTTLQSQERLSEANAPAFVARLFSELGGTYIKLGQFIASSPTLFPPNWITAMSTLLDSTPPTPFSSIEKVIRSEIGLSAFKSVDPNPIGSASIAQVHRATLKNNTDVVIKVMKPSVEPQILTDLNFLLISSKVLEFLLPDLKRSGVVAIVEDIRTATLEELDFTKEAAKLSTFRTFLNTEGLTASVTAPLPYPNLSSKRCLVMEYIEGERMIEREEGGEELIITALNTWTESVLKESFFHADLHSGNLLVTPDNRIAFIDFGITGSISDKVKGAVASMTAALATSDYVEVARALTNMGATETEVDVEKFGAAIASTLQEISTVSTTIQQTPTGELQVDINESEVTDALLKVVAIADEYGLKLPRDFGLLVKQVLYFDRYLKVLAPDLDVASDVRVRGLGDDGDGGEVAQVDRKSVV